MAQYKLTYFNGRGKAEIIRLIFTAAGVPFEDVRIPRDKWPELKPTFPMNQVPVLETEGLTLFQSHAIARYLAKKFGLGGKTDIDQVKADIVVDSVQDAIKPLVHFWLFEKDETKKAELKKNFIEETLPKFLCNLEKLLKTNNNGDTYFVGDDLTWADLQYLTFVHRLQLAGLDISFENYPKLKALTERISGLPRIAEYVAKRPETEF